MPDRKKVLRGIKHCDLGSCATTKKHCPYWKIGDSDCRKKLFADVVALLKSDEADINALSAKYADLLDRTLEGEAYPLIDDGEDFASIGGAPEIVHKWKCGSCGKVICYSENPPKTIKFCLFCGAAVKRDD